MNSISNKNNSGNGALNAYSRSINKLLDASLEIRERDDQVPVTLLANIAGIQFYLPKVEAFLQEALFFGGAGEDVAGVLQSVRKRKIDAGVLLGKLNLGLADDNDAGLFYMALAGTMEDVEGLKLNDVPDRESFYGHAIRAWLGESDASRDSAGKDMDFEYDSEEEDDFSMGYSDFDDDNSIFDTIAIEDVEVVKVVGGQTGDSAAEAIEIN